MAEKEETKETKTPKSKKSTIDLTLINSNGQKITVTGPCSDISIKTVMRSIPRHQGQKIEIT